MADAGAGSVIFLSLDEAVAVGCCRPGPLDSVWEAGQD